MKAVRKHTDNKWIILYVERWLKTPIQMADGTLQERTKGTPQGGVISPILSNLFLHYVFDKWISMKHQTIKWCRYADDAVIHCTTEQQAKQVLAELETRYNECGLELHPDKTKIIYCKDSKRKGTYLNMQFDFLGYTFRCRRVANQNSKKLFSGFAPAVSTNAQKSMRAKTKMMRFYKRTELSINEIAVIFNPVIRGWINYYGKFCFSELESVLRHFNKTLVAWARRKYAKISNRGAAIRLLLGIVKSTPRLFYHWELGMHGFV